MQCKHPPVLGAFGCTLSNTSLTPPNTNRAALQEDSKEGDPDEMEELKPTALSFWVSSLFQNSLLEQQVALQAQLLCFYHATSVSVAERSMPAADTAGDDQHPAKAGHPQGNPG